MLNTYGEAECLRGEVPDGRVVVGYEHVCCVCGCWIGIEDGEAAKIKWVY